MCDDRISVPAIPETGLDAARRDRIVQLFVRAWRRVQQRTGRSWEKKRDRWLELLAYGTSSDDVEPGGSKVSANQLRVALNNLVTFAQLPPIDTHLLREAIHADYQAVRILALKAVGDGTGQETL